MHRDTMSELMRVILPLSDILLFIQVSQICLIWILEAKLRE